MVLWGLKEFQKKTEYLNAIRKCSSSSVTQRIQISQWFILSRSNALSFLVLSQLPHPNPRDNPNERGKGKGFWGVLFPEARSGLLVFHDLMIVTAPHRLWLESLASQLDSFVQKVITECLGEAKNHFRLSLEAPALEELAFYLERLKTNSHTRQRRMIGCIGWGGAILFRVAREDLGDKMAFEWVRGHIWEKDVPGRWTTKYKSKSVPVMLQE